MEQGHGKSKNSCYTYFRIAGDFDPEEVTAILGLQPDNSWKIGDVRRDGISTYTCANWSFGRCDEYDGLVENQMRKTIAPLLDKIDLLNTIRLQKEVSFFLEVVPTIYVGEPTPSLDPTFDIMEFCIATRTQIDTDIYVYAMDSDEDEA